MFPESKPNFNIDFKRRQNSLFFAGPVIKCFVIPPTQKLKKKKKKKKKKKETTKISFACRGFKEHDLITWRVSELCWP